MGPLAGPQTRPGEWPASVAGSGYPFRGPGFLARVVPFAVVAVLAEASLALPPGPQSQAAVIASIVLLLATAAEFLLPWRRLPAWLSVLVPLTYTGQVLALILAAGPTSGVGIVILIPLIWTALFHNRWASACIVAAIMLLQGIISITPVAEADSVTARRVLLWGALGTLISVAAHGLRDRIGRWQQENARLQEQLREVTIMEDRQRIATDLRDKVIQQIFGAGLTLQGAASLTTEREVRRRLESSVTDLDRAVRLVRQAIFGLENRLQARGLRQDVLDLCGDLTPVPEVSFSGPVDRALNPGARAELLGKLREALGMLGGQSVPARVSIAAGEDSCLAVVEADLGAAEAAQERSARDLSGLRDAAARAGARIDVESGGARLAWRFPVPAPAGGALRA
jgi:signal transduction histidine kinase